MKKSIYFLGLFLLLSVMSGCITKEKNAEQRHIVRISDTSRENYPQILEDQDVNSVKEKIVGVERVKIFKRSLGKVWYMGLLVPVTGQYEAIGEQITDLAIFAVNFQKGKNVRIVVLDSKDTKEGAIAAAKIAAKLKLSVVVGPVLSFQTVEVEKILAPQKIKIISLSNDATLASANVYPFGLYPGALLTTSLNYNRDQGGESYGLVLASNQGGYKLGKEVSEILKDIGGVVIATEYYQRQKDTFASIAKALYENRTRSYKSDENGNLSILTHVQKNKMSPEEKELRDKMPTVKREIDSIYTDAKGEDLYRLIQEILNSGFKNKDLTFVVDDNSISMNDFVLDNYNLSNVIFSSVATSRLKKMESDIESLFGYKPSRVALLASDAVSVLMYLIKKGTFNDKAFYSLSGYKGLYGDFRFTEQGLVQRRFGIYKMHNNRPEMVYYSPLFV